MPVHETTCGDKEQVRLHVCTRSGVSRVFGWCFILLGFESFLSLIVNPIIFSSLPPDGERISLALLLGIMLLVAAITTPAGLWCLGYNRLVINRGSDRVEMVRTIFGLKVRWRIHRLSEISEIIIVTEAEEMPTGELATRVALHGVLGLLVDMALHKAGRSSRAAKGQLWQWVSAKAENSSFLLAGPIRQDKAVGLAATIAEAVGLPAPT